MNPTTAILGYCVAVINPSVSEMLQKLAHASDIGWVADGKVVRNTERKYLYIHKDTTGQQKRYMLASNQPTSEYELVTIEEFVRRVSSEKEERIDVGPKPRLEK